MAAGYSLAWALVYIPFMIAFFLLNSHATLLLAACLTPLQGLFNFLVFMSPKVRSAKQPRRGENLTWRQAFIKAYMSRGERRKTGGLTQEISELIAGYQNGINVYKGLWSQFCITTNQQSSSNPEQDCAPSEKLPLSNHHLHDDLADDMKEEPTWKKITVYWDHSTRNWSRMRRRNSMKEKTLCIPNLGKFVFNCT